MLTLDEQIARLADHAEQAAIAAERSAEGRAVVVDLHHRHPRRRRWVAVAAAGTAAAGVVGLMVAPRWVAPESPAATVLPAASTAAPTTTHSTTMFPESTAPRPTRYPALPAGDPRDGTVTGGYRSRSVGSFDPPVGSAVALVARLAEDETVEGVQIEVLAEPLAWSTDSSDSRGTVTVGGREYDSWEERGSPVNRWLVDRDDPRVKISGIDPDAYLTRLGELPARGIVADGGTVGFDITPPPGWEVVVAPTPRLPSWVQPQIFVPAPGGGEPFSVDVSLAPDLPKRGSLHPLRRVDVNGVEGWISEESAYIVSWPLGDGEWATAAAGTSADDALELARSVEFVDEATWRERYDGQSASAFCDSAQTLSDRPFDQSADGLVEALRELDTTGLADADREELSSAIDLVEEQIAAFNDRRADGWSTEPWSSVASRICDGEMWVQSVS